MASARFDSIARRLGRVCRPAGHHQPQVEPLRSEGGGGDELLGNEEVGLKRSADGLKLTCGRSNAIEVKPLVHGTLGACGSPRSFAHYAAREGRRRRPAPASLCDGVKGNARRPYLRRNRAPAGP